MRWRFWRKATPELDVRPNASALDPTDMRSIESFAHDGEVIRVGERRRCDDAAVLAAPDLWVSVELDDAGWKAARERWLARDTETAR